MNMANTYSDEFLDELTGSIDMEALVEELTGEEFDSTGKICCPFHEEDTGSFSVLDDMFKCFGACGKDGRGNAIHFVKKIKNYSFIEAVEYLKGRSEVSDEVDIEDKGVKDKELKDEVKPKVRKKKKRKPAITPAVYRDIVGNTSAKGNGYRGIGDKVLAKLGCLTEYSKGGAGEDVVARYYMYTEDQKLVAFKKRICDKDKLKETGKKKDFRAIGRVRAENDLYGSYGHPNGGKVALIVGGEEDVHASLEMIVEEFKRKGWAVPVVLSPTVGEASCLGQIKHNYSYLDKFDEIIIALDNDEAGIKATEEIMKVLPKGKGSQVQWRHNDPNEYLLKGEGKEFREDFWRKKKDIPVGIVASTDLLASVIEEISRPKTPLPPFMSAIEDILAGGIPPGVLINLAGDTGSGKTTIVNELLYFWYFNSPYLTLTISLELNKGQYGEALYSRHLGVSLKNIRSLEEKKKIIYDNMDKIEHLQRKENGDPRFILIDDRDGSIEQLKAKILEAVDSLGANFIAIDPINDLFEGLDISAQEEFLNWEKRVCKSKSVNILNICHINKEGQGSCFDSEGNIKWPTKDVFHGTSSIGKSGALNLLFARNMNAVDLVEQNTTHVLIKKNRITSITGPVSPWYYDRDTHTMHDKETFFKDKDTVQEVG